jgi:hypothetical protein
MRRLYALLAITLFAIPAYAQGEKKTDVTGKWLFTVTSELGTGTPTVTFKQAGDSLTGHYSSTTFGEVDFKGTFKDQKLNFSMKVDAGGNAITVTYSGEMDGENAMKGSVDFGGMGAGTFTGKRQQP